MTTSVNYRASNGAGGSVAATPGGGSGGGGGSSTSAYITGIAGLGSLLTANVIGTVATTWQWKNDGVNISGATASTYTVVSTDQGHSLTVVVNGTIVSPALAIPAASTFRALGALGTNVTGANSTLGNRLFTNAFFNGARMQKTGVPFSNCTRDSVTGWPTESFYVVLATITNNGTTNIDGALPPGTYTWNYTYPTSTPSTLTFTQSGNTPLSIGVTGISFGTPTSAGGFTTQPFTFTFATQGTLTLSFSAPITFADCPFDGQSTTIGQPLYRAEALAYYSKNPVLRLLDFWGSNGRSDITYAQRPPNYDVQLAQDILSWERGIDFFLACKAYPGSQTKRLMVNLPQFSDGGDYATQLATLFNSKGVPADCLDIEFGNEEWQNQNAAGRFHGYENAAVNDAQGIANYEIQVNSVAPDPIYQSQGIVVTGMSIDTTGLCTVTLAAACSSYLDVTTGQPFIVNGASLIVSSNTVLYNKNSAAADIGAVMTVSNVSGSTFQYSTGVSGAGGSFTGQTPNTQMYFNPASFYLQDNLGFTIANMRVKWYVRRTYTSALAWRAVRPRATYKDTFYLNLSPATGIQGGQKFPYFESLYSVYLDGTGAWLSALAQANYAVPVGTVASEDDLFNPAMTTSLYYTLQGAGYANSVDNQSRGLVYTALINGWKPFSYEGGAALQTASSSTFGIAASIDSRMETYMAVHQRVVLQNGIARCMNFHGSPHAVVNGSSGNGLWQALQFFNDSITSGDANYSAKTAGLQKFTEPVFYTNINGNDLCSLNVAYYQNNSALTTLASFIQSATGALFWGTGGTAVARNVDFVYCNNTFSSRQVFVDGTDAVGSSTPVQVWLYPPDASGGTLLGTVHLAANGITNASNASTPGACPDPITWTPTLAGPYVVRLIMPAGAGTGPGILQVRFA